MKVTFFGVRGSIASPGQHTVKYGGNTPCVLVEIEDRTSLQTTFLIFDAGTGIKSLGEKLSKNSSDLNLFISHYHWDHIQGFPFFSPAYQKNRTINLITNHLKDDNPKSVLDQMTTPHFPVSGDQLQAMINEFPLDHKGQIIIDNISISTLPLNHPGGGTAFRVDSQYGSMTYITDNELYPPTPPKTSYENWISFVRGTDLLIHDAMYKDNELEKIHGWGHSLISQAIQLGRDADIANLVLFHHDPSRTDDQLDSILMESRKIYESTGQELYLAKEGDCYSITNSVVTVSANK